MFYIYTCIYILSENVFLQMHPTRLRVPHIMCVSEQYTIALIFCIISDVLPKDEHSRVDVYNRRSCCFSGSPVT